jgi:hypothetical protein
VEYVLFVIDLLYTYMDKKIINARSNNEIDFLFKFIWKRIYFLQKLIIKISFNSHSILWKTTHNTYHYLRDLIQINKVLTFRYSLIKALLPYLNIMFWHFSAYKNWIVMILFNFNFFITVQKTTYISLCFNFKNIFCLYSIKIGKQSFDKRVTKR